MKVMAQPVLLASLMLWLSPLSLAKEDICYSNVTDPYLLFSTKTSYFQVDNEDEKPFSEPGCEAKSFWLLARHGTRNPGSKDIKHMQKRGPELKDKIVEIHDQGKGVLCEADINRFRSWKFNLSTSADSQLTQSGEDEQFDLGHRFRKRFPGLLDKPFDKEKYTIRHTTKLRTEQSAKAYVRGAFPGENVTLIPAVDPDTLLRFYDFCPKWISEVDENNATYVEHHLFEQSDLMMMVVSNVNLRLGFGNNSNGSEGNKEGKGDTVGFEDVQLIYDICRYEKAFWPEMVSVWCSPFEKEDLLVLEYHQDLEYWYKNGYANDLNYKMSCPLIRDVVQIFDDDNNNNNSNNNNNNSNNNNKNDSSNNKSMALGTFYFSHSEALLPFLGLLDLYRDSKQPKHDNYAEMSTRTYKTSYISSFSASVALVLLECKEEPAKRVVAFHQERPVKMGKCKDTICSWKEFKEKYQSDIACSFEEMCKTLKTTTRTTSSKKSSSKKTDGSNSSHHNHPGKTASLLSTFGLLGFWRLFLQ